jgi:4-diphosphocytidyl-2-C-methyl-D-erythritol kinase
VLSNDLQAAALTLRPDLGRALRAATDAGALAALVSGSGPTVAALAQDEQAAVRLAAELAGAGVFRTVRAVHGPVPGARLV